MIDLPVVDFGSWISPGPCGVRGALTDKSSGADQPDSCRDSPVCKRLETNPLLPAMPSTDVHASLTGDLTPTERLDEVARLLALGYLRLRARRQAEKANDPNRLRSFGLDFRGEGSVCDTDTHADRERR
jgi:hypothetical protein